MKTQNQKNFFFNRFALFIGIICVSSASIFIKLSQAEVSSIVIAGYRMTISTIVLGILMLFYQPVKLSTISSKDWFLLALSGIFLATHFICWITSLQLTSTTSSVVLVTTTPLWVALLSPIFLKEKVNKSVFFGLFIALIGGIIVSLSKDIYIEYESIDFLVKQPLNLSNNLLGDFLALLGAFAAAGYMLIGRKIRASIDILPYSFLVYGFASLVLGIIIIISKRPVLHFSNQIWLWLFLLAFIPQLLGHTIFNWTLKYLPASNVTVALLGEPVGASILALIFFKEKPAILELAGGSLILLGIFFANIKFKKD